MISENPEMAAAQQQRMRDSLRLMETKRKNIVETIGKLREQYQRLMRHHELDAELDEHNRRLFALTKEFATIEKEAEEMDRFETFESIITPFLRMKILESEAEENRRTGSEQEQGLRELGDRMEIQKKHLAEVSDANKETETSTEEQHRMLCRISRLDGMMEQLGISLKHVRDMIADREEYMKELSTRQDVADSQLDECKKQLSDLRGEMHVFESHSQMLEEIDAVIAMLLRLEELAEDRTTNRNRREQALKEQTAQNDLLGRVYNEYMELSQQIEGMQDEMNVHRTNIRGMQSYNVQEHAIKLKSRLEMLVSAKSLWNRINTGYKTIEEKTRRITELSQQIEYGLRTERELTVKVEHLGQTVEDMRYSLDMSKSQNVIGLRQDLKEGTACTVCGATHHPYHSDTMLEQSKLIGDMRGEYETQRLELQGLKKQLDDLHDELTRALGEKVAEQQNLEMVRLRQDEDVKEWSIYSELDPTFLTCNEDTDGDARMATLRQLIDNAQRDERQAQKELDEFNFHSNQIDVLSEKISELEERKDELTMRMGEVNTACQVLASQLEGINSFLKLLDERYHQVYDQLMAVVTVQDWYEMWKQSGESMRMQLRDMHRTWSGLREKIAVRETELATLEVKSMMLKKTCEKAATMLDKMREREHEMTDVMADIRESRGQQLGEADVMESLEKCLGRAVASREERNKAYEEYLQLLLEQKLLEGAHGNVRHAGEVLDERARSQRSQVDEWMHAYNAQHPPVQYSELTDVLTKDLDWNQRRSSIRENRMQTALEQNRVKALQAEIVALEVETGTIPSAELASRKMQADIQIKDYEQQLRDVDMQIARLEVGLLQ